LPKIALFRGVGVRSLKKFDFYYKRHVLAEIYVAILCKNRLRGVTPNVVLEKNKDSPQE